MKANHWLKRNALLIYFIIAFGLSWSLTILVTGPGRFTGQATQRGSLILMVLAMVSGPVVGGFLMTYVVEGRKGLADLFRRMTRWNVGAGWIAAAVLTNTLLVVVLLRALSVLVSPDYLQPFMLIGLLGGMVNSFLEEIGWTGFATPQLMKKYSPLASSLILGVLWGIWHLMAGFLGSIPGTEDLWLAEALIFWVGGLTAYRVLMTWVYTHTKSLLIGQVMHTFFTGIFVAMVHGLTVQQSTLFYISEGVALWLITGILIAATGRTLALRKPHSRAEAGFIPTAGQQ